jgi:hypothetical protein
MPKSPEELKAALIKRAEERRADPVVEIEQPDVKIDLEALEEEGVIALSEEELMGMMNESEMNHALTLVEEEGFDSYVNGLEVEQNPYIGEEAEEIVSEAWVDGWYSAHIQACVANIMLNAKALVEATDPDVAGAHLDALTEAVQVAEGAIDFNETQEFWDSLMEVEPDEDEPQKG